MKIALVIGESFNPSDFGDASTFEGALRQFKASGKTLLKWLKLTHHDAWEKFDSLNIRNRSGETIQHEALQKQIARYRVIVLVGRLAERRVLGSIRSEVPYRIDSLGRQVFYVLPHPSGRNRLLNDKAVREKCFSMGKAIVNSILLRRGM